MGRSFGCALIALVVLYALGSEAHAEHELVGLYDVAGSEGQAGYTGTLRIFEEKGHLAFSLERSTGLKEQGRLRRRGRRWQFRSDLSAARGIARSLAVQAAAPLQRLFGSYERDERGNLSGVWRITQGNRNVVARGTARLTRRPVTPPAVHVVVSVDWEGRDVTLRNVEAMKALRAALPGVPLTHFLNAAYFTKSDARPDELVARIGSVVLNTDERGLHLHGWRSLIDSAGVLFKTSPSYWGENIPLYPAGSDIGHEVEIAAYSVPQLRAIVRHSKAVLEEHGLSVGSAFRAGGWLATPEVLHAVRAEGFDIDSSSTDGSWHGELRGRRLHRRIFEVWPSVTRYSQPFTIATPAGQVLEMPDTGALADYVTAAEMEGHLRDAVARLASNPTRDVFVHFGFHQETAARYASRVSEALAAVRADTDPALLVFETLSASARVAGARRGSEGLGAGDSGLPLPTLREIPEGVQ